MKVTVLERENAQGKPGRTLRGGAATVPAQNLTEGQESDAERASERFLGGESRTVRTGFAALPHSQTCA